MEEYISHVDYKKMMENFKKGTPKSILNEGLEQEGNAFTAGLAKTKKGGEFKVGDKAVKDTSSYDASMEEEMHSFDDIKKDTPHAHKLKVNAPNLTGTIFKNEDGTYVFYDVDNYNADPSLPPFKTITDLMKHFGIKMQDLQEDMEESHQGNDQWHEEFQTAISAMGLAGEAEARIMKALDHTDPMAQYGSMQAPEAAREFVNDLGIVSADDYDDYDADYEEPRDDFDMAEVKKMQEIAGVGPEDDGREEDYDEDYQYKRYKRRKQAEKDEEEAENAEREDTDESLNMPPLQATGQTIVANEDQAPYGFSVLPPDERKQLAEYIHHYKTIKTEISKLLKKAGKSGKIMEGTKEEDEKVPAARPARYNDPTKTPKHKSSNLGGDRTGLVMTKTEMWEGADKMETSLGEKLHSAFNKVTDMAIKQLVADGWDESQAASFLKVEIEERAKEAINAQYDMH